MTRLEDIKAGVSVSGIAPEGTVEVVSVEWYGDGAIQVIYRDGGGAVKNRLLYRDEESSLSVGASGGAWSFDGDGAMLRLVSEAMRMRLAYLFDPYLAIHTSRIEALPHQITAVYGEMLRRQLLRFLLADDPGAGKTIMTGLLIKELGIRGDLERCLIVAPGNLVEQWQDELSTKFGLSFAILSRDQLETSGTATTPATEWAWAATHRDAAQTILRLDYLGPGPGRSGRGKNSRGGAHPPGDAPQFQG
jgi:hypothetical protein